MASHRGRHELLNKWAQETRPRGKKKGPWSLEERRKEVLGLRGGGQGVQGRERRGSTPERETLLANTVAVGFVVWT